MMMKIEIYQTAGSDGTEAIDDVDENETGLDVAGQEQRVLLLNRKLGLQQIN